MPASPLHATPRLASLAWIAVPLSLLALAQVALFAGASAGLGPLAGEASWAMRAVQLFAAAGVLVLLWRVWLASRYRPVESVVDAQLPEVTVIVPAFNEGAQVFKTLQSLVASDYPKGRLHIVAVDDGSQDDTWLWIARGRAVLGEVVTAVRCRENRGKRAALYEGFERARGEVIVTVDSDSEVLPDTLRNLVSPFVRDARVGAVAGNVRVLNGGGPLARMLDVAFAFSFEFMRASESMVDTVTCCPGALSAYRRPLVEAMKDEWMAQTFLGEPAAIGEDRAMTNLVLRAGHLVRFQSNAVVLTEVPTTTSRLSRMFLRWARSNVRETLVLSRFVFTRFREGGAWGARVNCAFAALGTLIRAAAFVPTLVLLTLHPQALAPFALALLLWAVLPAAVYALARGGRTALWSFPYALYSAACLSWIGPWALLTPHRSAWLTRALPEQAPAHLEVEPG